MVLRKRAIRAREFRYKKTFYDVIFIICCAREARASIVLNIERVQFVL